MFNTTTSNTTENYYKILGVKQDSTREEIKKAYRSLSLKYHPDKNGGNPEAISQFQKLSEAYETLGDEQRRAQYDMMNSNPFLSSMGSMGMGGNDIDDLLNVLLGGRIFGAGPPGIHIFTGDPSMMHNLPHNHVNPFSSFFQSPPSPPPPPLIQKPAPITKTLTITMEQVLNGGQIPFDLERWIIENENKVHEHETLYVQIPKGIDDQEIIVLKDKGNVISENNKGDVKLYVKIDNNTEFERKGLDLIYNKQISLKESLCGFSFELKYINGKSYTLNNKTGNIIPPQYVKVIPNMGLTRENHTGNLLIHFHVNFPEKLSEEQVNALKEIL